MKFREQEVRLSRINTSDPTYRITTRTRTDDLVASIDSLGLISPPVLFGAPAEWVVVSGFRRIAACRALNRSAITVRILDARTPLYDCARYAIAANALERPLNLIEQSRALCLLSKHCRPDSERLSASAAELGLPDNPVMIKKLTALSDVTPAIAQAVLSGVLSIAMALDLAELDHLAGESLAILFSDLKLSLNKQREIFTLLTEIAKRESLPLGDILSAEAFNTTRASLELDRTQKTRAIRTYLRSRRFPALAASEKHFKDHLHRLALDHRIKLHPPRDFEGQTYTLTMPIVKMRDLDDLIHTLEKLRQHPSMPILLDKKL